MRKSLLPTAVRTVSSVLILSALALPCAHAAGLGKLTVLSSLGQPLRAEIELTAVSKDDAGAMAAKLAPIDAFRKANVEFNPALKSLHFAVEKRGGRHVIRITSGQAINEPYVDMLLELKSSSGQLVREYTFLLDPAELRAASAQVVAPVTVTALGAVHATPAAKQAAAAAGEKPARMAHHGASARAEKSHPPAEEAKQAKGEAQYRVKRGDKLAAIAKNNKPDDVSLEQMLVALYRANPDAFIGNNINRLKVGKVLSVPDAETVGSIGKSEAKKVIVAQTSNFSSYRNRLAGAAAQAAPKKTAEAGQVGGGQIGAKVEERPTAAAAAKDKLKVSKAEAGKGDKSSGKGGAEDKLAKDKAAADAQARIKELEKNIGDLQAVVQLKSKDLAAQQKQAETPSAQAAASAAAASTAASASVSAAQPSVPPQKKAVVPPPAPEPGFFDFLDDAFDNPLENPMTLGGLGVVVLLLAYILVRRRRKKPAQPAEAEIADEVPEPTNSMFGTSGGQSVDTNNSMFNSSFTPSASLLDTNEVDPVAEADVYIAYGREAQAIEILKEALRNHPERNALRVKLLEIYASQKDVHAFDLLASELFSLTKGEGEDWVYVAGLGTSIDPGNPLYAGGELSEELLAQPASLQTSVTRPAEELDPDLRLAAPRAPESVQAGDAAAEMPISAEQLAHPDLSLDLSAAASGAIDFDLSAPVAETTAAPAEVSAPLEMPAVEPVEAAAPLPEVTAPIEVSAPAEAPMDEGLDFVSPEPEVATSAPAVAAPPEAALNFDLGELSVKHDQTEPAAPSEPALKVKELGNEALEYLADFKPAPTTDTHSPLEIAAAQASADQVEEVAAAQLPAVESAEVAAVSPAAEGGETTSATSSFDFDSINLDLQHLPQQEPSTMTSAPQDLDLSETGTVPAANIPAGGNAEMDTKLDLADAYLGIGDKEGARELLEEIIQEGAGDVVERAKAALAKIS